MYLARGADAVHDAGAADEHVDDVGFESIGLHHQYGVLHRGALEQRAVESFRGAAAVHRFHLSGGRTLLVRVRGAFDDFDCFWDSVHVLVDFYFCPAHGFFNNRRKFHGASPGRHRSGGQC